MMTRQDIGLVLIDLAVLTVGASAFLIWAGYRIGLLV